MRTAPLGGRLAADRGSVASRYALEAIVRPRDAPLSVLSSPQQVGARAHAACIGARARAACIALARVDLRRVFAGHGCHACWCGGRLRRHFPFVASAALGFGSLARPTLGGSARSPPPAAGGHWIFVGPTRPASSDPQCGSRAGASDTWSEVLVQGRPEDRRMALKSGGSGNFAIQLLQAHRTIGEHRRAFCWHLLSFWLCGHPWATSP